MIRGILKRKILKNHKKWLTQEGGEKADLRGARLEGAYLDYSCLSLWCGGLKMKIDDRLAIQFLYHLLSNVSCSENVSEEIKTLLLTPEIVDCANLFHRANECGVIKIPNNITEV